MDVRNQNEITEFFTNLNYIDRNILIKMGNKARLLAENEYNEPIILKLLQTKIESINH